MQLEWSGLIDLSAMHAAWCLVHFPQDTQHGSSAARQSATQLAEVAESLGVPGERFWETAFTLSVDCPRNQELAERLLVRLLPAKMRSPALQSKLAGCITAIENAFRAEFPNYLDDIQLRTGPLKQLWEAHGQGLLHFIGRLTSPELIVESAQVVLVQPILGGAGYAHLQTNRVHLEGVLTDADPRLPETLRLAWLLSQLDFERPVYSEQINAFQVRRVSGLAMIPPTLQAAAELELCEFSVETTRRAIELWHADPSTTNLTAVAEVLMTWWETYADGRPPWNIALTGLDRML